MPKYDRLVVADTEASATGGGRVFTELPPGANNVSIEVQESGTASVVTVFQSVDSSGAAIKSLFTLASGSSTLHVMTSTDNPRYLTYQTSGTMDCNIKIYAHFVKP